MDCCFTNEKNWFRYRAAGIVVEDGKILFVTDKTLDYYYTVGGGVHMGEKAKDCVCREMKEETGLDVKNLNYRGNMIIEYPNRIFDLDVFIASECEGEPKEFNENTSQWIEIQELLKKEKLLSNIIVLDRFFIKGLMDNACNIKMYIDVDEQENILGVKYSLEENI